MTITEYYTVLGMLLAIPCFSLLVWLHFHDKREYKKKHSKPK